MNREFKFQIEKVDDSGEFFGVAAVYGNVDLGGDLIRRGAFAKTVLENNHRVPLLLEHRIPIGIARIEDSDIGLKVHGELNLGKEVARDAYSDLKFFNERGKPYGMSIGYDPVRKKREGDIRILEEVRVLETSITLSPMNQDARVSSVKSEEAEELIDRWLAALESVKTSDPEKHSLYTKRFFEHFPLSAPRQEATLPSSDAAVPITAEPGPELHSVLQLISNFKL